MLVHARRDVLVHGHGRGGARNPSPAKLPRFRNGPDRHGSQPKTNAKERCELVEEIAKGKAVALQWVALQESEIQKTEAGLVKQRG